MKKVGWSALCIAVLIGCSESAGEGVGVSDDQPTGAGVGATCLQSAECRPGLTCASGRCAPAGTTPQGAGCRITAECAPDLYCDPARSACQPAGATPQGHACADTAECAPGLACDLHGFGGSCQDRRDEADEGQPCADDGACFAGLVCRQGACTGGLASLPQPWSGVACAPDEGPLRAYFEVPGGPNPLADFYRLPTPNDLRLDVGRPRLSDHPTPGDEALGFDLLGRYLDRIAAEQDHWGVNQAVLFRFSGRIDFSEASLTSGGDDPTIYIVDITPSSPEYGELQPVYWQASTQGSAYICDNWLSIRPTWGRPLSARTTYAAIVTTGVLGATGDPVGQDDDLADVLAATRPAEPHLATAWDRYLPLRLWMGERGLAADRIASAAVFTTGDPRQLGGALRDAARDHAPTLSALTTCAPGVRSPCEDDAPDTRGCVGTPDGLTEVHGKLLMPIFQRGAPPYLDAGGGLELSGGAPVLQRQEDVCVAMTLPPGEPPEEGWPVLLVAHGTGGTFRSHVGSTAPLVTGVEVDGRRLDMLTLGWDQVQHATRRGDSDLDPETLVYNFANPDAARGNFWQAAADLHAVVRFIETLDLTIDGRRVKANPSQLYVLGHSQGGTSAPIALPFEPAVRGAVLSGSGAGLTLSLLGKTSPLNIPAAVAAGLQDPMVSESHPALNLLQGWFDPVDPLTYAEYVGARQLPGVTTPRHTLHLIGLGDTYTPQPTLEIMATALRATLVEPQRGELPRAFLSTAPAPVSGNASVNGQRYTVVTRTYVPAGYDGHFVLYRDPDAQRDMQRFLSSAIFNGTPIIPE